MMGSALPREGSSVSFPTEREEPTDVLQVLQEPGRPFMCQDWLCLFFSAWMWRLTVHQRRDFKSHVQLNSTCQRFFKQHICLSLEGAQVLLALRSSQSHRYSWGRTQTYFWKALASFFQIFAASLPAPYLGSWSLGKGSCLEQIYHAKKLGKIRGGVIKQ